MLRAARHSRRRSRHRLALVAWAVLGVTAAVAAARPAAAEDATLADAWAYWEERPYLAIDARLLVAVGAPGARVHQDSLVETIRSQRDARPPDASVQADEQATLDRMTAEALGIDEGGGGAGAWPWLAGGAVILAGGALFARMRRRAGARAPASRAPARGARTRDAAVAGVARPACAAEPTPIRVEAPPLQPAGPAEPIALGDLTEALTIAVPGVASAADLDERALDLGTADDESGPAASIPPPDPGGELALDTGFDGELVPPDDAAPDDAPPSDAPWILPDETGTQLPPLAEPAPPAPQASYGDTVDLDAIVPALPRFTKLEVKEASLRELRESEIALGFPDGRLAKLALAKIEAIALVEIAGGGEACLVLDLALDWRALSEGGALRVVRLRSAASGAPAESLRLLAEELTLRSGAPLLSPGADGAVQGFGDLAHYAREVLLVDA